MSGQVGRLHVSAGGQALALAAASIAEIIRVPVCTPLPHGPPSLLGLANLRGMVLPVVSLASLLGEAPRHGTPQSRVVVLSGAPPVGLLVDAVAALSAAADGAELDPRALLARDFAAMGRGMAAGSVQAAPATPATPAMSRDALALIGLQLGGRDYAIRLDEVAEIMRLPKDWGTLPRMDESVLGVIGFRGGVLPLVGLAMLLGLEAAARPTRGIILIVRLAGAWIGLVADSVSTRFTLALDAIDPVPRLLTRAAGQAQLEGICRLEGGRKLVGLLAISRLFDPHLLAWLEDTAAAPMPQLAKPAAEAASEQVLLFDIGGVSYGLPIAAVDEVAPCPDKLARPPHVPDFILGVLSLRGRAVTVIDMARRLGAAPSPSRGRRVIVVSADGRQAGLAVDTVSGVRAVDQAALRPAPDVTPGTHAAFDRVALQQEGRMMLLVSAAFVVAQAARDLSAAFSGRAKATQPATP